MERSGVVWHTQGSGKSFSMIFYVRKIFRKQTGNFTFVVVTDREELDGQIYRNFLHTNTVTKAEVAQPRNSGEMRKFLGLNKRLVFTLKVFQQCSYEEISEITGFSIPKLKTDLHRARTEMRQRVGQYVRTS